MTYTSPRRNNSDHTPIYIAQSNQERKELQLTLFEVAR